MFGKNLKSSILVLPWLLLPLAVMSFFMLVAEPWILENGWSGKPTGKPGVLPSAGGEIEFVIDEGLEYEGDEDFEEFVEEEEFVFVSGFRWEYSRECFVISTIIAIIANFIFLLVIPCALGGYNVGKKRFEFYLGFFINLAGLITLPLVYGLVYELDTTTFFILIALHAISFMATYIIGSRFVSPAYKKAFWFA